MTPQDEAPNPPASSSMEEAPAKRAEEVRPPAVTNEPPEARASTPVASPPQSALRADSSPIEGERETWLKARAKAMRREMTPQERIIWRILHEGELVVLNWRRQSVFGDYILDFLSHPARIVVEVDGAQHGESEQTKRDSERTAWLEAQGYRVLRFWNPETVRDRNGVWVTIHAAAMETPAKARMQRWREKHIAAVREINSRLAEHGARLPLDGGGAREAGGGGARGERGESPREVEPQSSRASPPQSALPPSPFGLRRTSRADSSSIEEERGASSGESE